MYQNIRDNILLFLIVFLIVIVFSLMKRLDPLFKKAITNYSANYEFQSGNTTRRIMIYNNKIRMKKGSTNNSDFKIIILDMIGVIKKTKDDPGNMLQLLMENKIDKIGNNYYLFKFGYLFGLCDRYISTKFQKSTAGSKATG